MYNKDKDDRRRTLLLHAHTNMSKVIPWTQDPVVLYAAGAWKLFVPREGQTPVERFNALTRLSLYLTMGAYAMRSEPKFLFMGGTAIIGLMIANMDEIKSDKQMLDERVSEVDAVEAKRRASVIQKTRDQFVTNMTTNPRESTGRGQVVPTDEELRLGGRPLLNDPFDDYGSLFDEQKVGPLKVVTSKTYS